MPSTTTVSETSLAADPVPSPRPATLSVLLVNYNMAGQVVRCVQNICETLPANVSAEILVADNSSDPEFRLSPRTLPGATLIECENRGWVDALNRLLPLATGDYCLVMHSDVELDDDCLNRLLNYMESHPRVAIASPDLHYPDGSPCRIRTQFPTLATEAAQTANHVTRAILRRSMFSEQPCWDRTADAQVDMIMSVCMVVRRDFLQRIGKVNSRLQTYYGNDCLCAKASQLGYSCSYVLAADAIHFERFTASEDFSQSPEMAYKTDAFSSLATMQSDYLVFLRELYPKRTVFSFRLLLLVQDVVLLAAQLKSFRSRPGNIRNVTAAIRVLCYLPRR